jgi:hypothetical protein
MAAQGVDVRGTIRRYYTPNEVSLHNAETNCWISWLGKVYDLTPLIKKYALGSIVLNLVLIFCLDETVGPIIKAAGTDISNWFDSATGEVT